MSIQDLTSLDSNNATSDPWAGSRIAKLAIHTDILFCQSQLSITAISGHLSAFFFFHVGWLDVTEEARLRRWVKIRQEFHTPWKKSAGEMQKMEGQKTRDNY